MSSEINGVHIQGHFDDRFTGTVEQFADNIRTGNDVGASFALSVEGEMVIDIWGGSLDEAGQRPWQEDSLVNVYSSTKTVSFLCALVAAERGLIDFDATVATYWPEFAANGKEDVRVWHLMDHAAGLSGLQTPVSIEDVYNWEKITALLANQQPWWEPGTASGYHALTQGWLIGEVIRRVTGRSIGRFLQEEIAGPLDADFLISVPDKEFHRIGNLIVPEGAGNISASDDPDSIASRTFANPLTRAEDSWTDAWRRAEIPAANGHGNARSLVRLHTALANGGSAFGVDLMSAETASSIMVPRIEGTDLVLGVPMTFGLGFGLNRGPIPMSPNENACFWGGWGGSLVLIDQDAHVAMSYVMNRMFPGLLGDTRSYVLRGLVFDELG